MKEKLGMLLNPTFWLVIVLWTALTAFVSFGKGAQVEHAVAEVAERKASEKAATVLAVETLKVLNLERTLNETIAANKTEREKEKKDAKAENDNLRADLRTGAKRLSFAVRACRPASAPGDTAVASPEANAELSPTAAGWLVGLVEEGDDAIRDLNGCIDDYNAVRTRYNERG